MNYLLPANSLCGNQPVQIHFPDHWDVQVSEIEGAHRKRLTYDELQAKTRATLGCPRISQGAKNAKTAVIIFDDLTRPTPLAELSQIITAELMAAGVPREGIYFMAAVGMHRAMGREDYVRKLGEGILDRYRVYSHNPFMEGTCVGRTVHGLDVVLNADVIMADFKIAVGTIIPHSLYGFGGGGKTILPGIASAETIRQNHLMDDVKSFSLAKTGTVNRANAIEAAAMAGLNIKIDCLLNGCGEICDLFAGDLAAVTEEAVRESRNHYRAEFIPDADIVLANNYFKPSEANTAYTPRTIDSLKKTGGDYILSAHTPQGSAPHYLYSRWGFSDVGGVLWDGEFAKKPPIKNFIGFTSHMDMGMGESWFIGRDEMVFEKDWSNILRLLDAGEPTAKKVAVYPFACSQII